MSKKPKIYSKLDTLYDPAIDDELAPLEEELARKKERFEAAKSLLDDVLI